MWTTKIIDITKNKTTADYTVEFYKDAVLEETFTFERVSNPDSIKRLIHDQLQQYKKIDATQAESILGPVDLDEFEPVVITPVKPTLEEKELIKYAEKLGDLVKLKRALDLGIIDVDLPKYVQTLSYLRNNFEVAKHLDLIH